MDRWLVGLCTGDPGPGQTIKGKSKFANNESDVFSLSASPAVNLIFWRVLGSRCDAIYALSTL